MFAMNTLDTARALDEIDRAPRCGKPIEINAADVIASLARKGLVPKGASTLESDIEEAKRTATPGVQAYYDVIAGRFRLTRDRSAGLALLAAAQEEAAKTASVDSKAKHALEYVRVTLALEAAADGRAEDAIGAIASELGTDPGARCVLALGVDEDRRFAAVRDDAGLAFAEIGTRSTPDLQASFLVPPSVVARLERCDEVHVYAPPPIHGLAGLLPPGVAWSYRSGAAPDSGAVPPRRLVVSDVETPESLGLPRLARWSEAPTASPTPTTWLHGTEATPARVLDAMADASEIEIHAHGLVDLSVSDASFIVLPPDDRGRYALTAGDIRQRRLSGHPIVVLAACRAAMTAPYLHASWSLPTAFISAGARAVFASSSPIQDAEAGRFFDAVLTRLRAGGSPARALRDVRLSWTGSSSSGWTGNVLVFD
jgi:hypothetical protein